MSKPKQKVKAIKFKSNDKKDVKKKSMKRSRPDSDMGEESTGTVETEIINEKLVTFNERSEERRTLSRRDYSDEEKELCWFTEKEMSSIVKSCIDIAAKIDSGMVLDDEKFSSRGLEQLTRIVGIATYRHRCESIDAVLNEEDYQTSNNFKDPDAIAHLYEQSTASSLMWARTRALQDQRVAEACSDI